MWTKKQNFKVLTPYLNWLSFATFQLWRAESCRFITHTALHENHRHTFFYEKEDIHLIRQYYKNWTKKIEYIKPKQVTKQISYLLIIILAYIQQRQQASKPLNINANFLWGWVLWFSTVEPFHNCHPEYRRKWLLWRGCHFGEVEV